MYRAETSMSMILYFKRPKQNVQKKEPDLRSPNAPATFPFLVKFARSRLHVIPQRDELARTDPKDEPSDHESHTSVCLEAAWPSHERQCTPPVLILVLVLRHMIKLVCVMLPNNAPTRNGPLYPVAARNPPRPPFSPFYP